MYAITKSFTIISKLQFVFTMDSHQVLQALFHERTTSYCNNVVFNASLCSECCPSLVTRRTVCLIISYFSLKFVYVLNEILFSLQNIAPTRTIHHFQVQCKLRMPGVQQMCFVACIEHCNTAISSPFHLNNYSNKSYILYV